MTPQRTADPYPQPQRPTLHTHTRDHTLQGYRTEADNTITSADTEALKTIKPSRIWKTRHRQDTGGKKNSFKNSGKGKDKQLPHQTTVFKLQTRDNTVWAPSKFRPPARTAERGPAIHRPSNQRGLQAPFVYNIKIWNKCRVCHRRDRLPRLSSDKNRQRHSVSLTRANELLNNGSLTIIGISNKPNIQGDLDPG